MFKKTKYTTLLICSLLMNFFVKAQEAASSGTTLQDSYAVMVKVPQELFAPIDAIQQFILQRLQAINEEIETANKFTDEKVSRLENPEVLKPDGLHMTLQMIADARKIYLTHAQLVQVKEILYSIASSLPTFNLVNDVDNLQFTLMGNFVAIEFIPAPEKLEKLVTEIKQKLSEAGITFGPVYPTFKAHISLFKSKNPLVKVAIRSLADGWSGDVKERYQALAPARIASFPIDEFLLTTMDAQRKIIPVEEFKLGMDKTKAAIDEQKVDQAQVVKEIKSARASADKSSIQQAITTLQNRLEKIASIKRFMPVDAFNTMKKQIEQALAQLKEKLSKTL